MRRGCRECACVYSLHRSCPSPPACVNQAVSSEREDISSFRGSLQSCSSPGFHRCSNLRGITVTQR